MVKFPGDKIAGSSLFAISAIFATAMWGLGCWWLVPSHPQLGRCDSLSDGLTFNMGFWGFLFPVRQVPSQRP